MKNRLFTASLALNLVALAGAAYYANGKLSPAPRIGYAETKQSVYDALPVGPSDVVFLGDSILDYGEWHELVPGAKNRAISGATTRDVLNRLPTLGSPATVVLSVGVNDLQRGEDLAGTIGRYQQIVSSLKARGVRVLALPVLPVNQEVYRRVIVPRHPGITVPRDLDVLKLNTAILKLGITVLYVPVLSDAQIPERYTLDGLHLNGQGLRLVADAVNAKLKEKSK